MDFIFVKSLRRRVHIVDRRVELLKKLKRLEHASLELLSLGA